MMRNVFTALARTITLSRVLAKGLGKLHPAFGGCSECTYAASYRQPRPCHDLPVHFPIDVVYSWVDGADPLQSAKRNQHSALQKKLHDNATEAARFRDNQELRYSLRSLEKFAPWVRRIVIVTDNQIPHWLDTAHPGIHIVDHTRFIPAHCLPTFNSHVIEAYLHTLPNLSNHFIYFNDDFFLSRPCSPTDFFTPNGVPLAFVDWRARRRNSYKKATTPHAASYGNTLKILHDKHMQTNPDFLTAHGPHPQTRDNAAAAFSFYKQEIEAFSCNKFRTMQELAFYAHALPLWAYAQKRLAPYDEQYYYVQAKRADRLVHYQAILASLKSLTPPLFFCINDVGNGTSDAWSNDLQEFLAACFPKPSRYELQQDS